MAKASRASRRLAALLLAAAAAGAPACRGDRGDRGGGGGSPTMTPAVAAPGAVDPRAPEGALRAFADALDSGDVVRIVQMYPPAVREHATREIARAQRLGGLAAVGAGIRAALDGGAALTAIALSRGDQREMAASEARQLAYQCPRPGRTHCNVVVVHHADGHWYIADLD